MDNFQIILIGSRYREAESNEIWRAYVIHKVVGHDR